MRLKLGVLLFATALFAAAAAHAECCNVLTLGVGPDDCNVFGCNCAGPCSNFGHTCARGPISNGDLKGYCPGYTWCDTGGICGPNRHCVPSTATSSWCLPNSPKATQDKVAAQQPEHISASASSAAAAERFREIDADKNGHLSFEEVKAWAAKDKSHPSDNELKKKFDAVDANKDGRIHPAEFDKPAAPKKK